MDSTRASATRLLASIRSMGAAARLEVRGVGGALVRERPLQRRREQAVVLVGGGEDPALRDLPGQVLQQLLQRLGRDAPGRRVVDVDLPVLHPDGVEGDRKSTRLNSSHSQ